MSEIESHLEIDWKLKLCQILESFLDAEGVMYANWWKEHGISWEERLEIERTFDEYVKLKARRKAQKGKE